MFDVIGDIHGYAAELEELLERMGYLRQSGVFRHPRRMALFCGDFIDRGPEIRDVLEIVRSMTDNGSARAVMGNHEFNALAFHTPVADPSRQFLRPHTERNVAQHAATLRQLSESELQSALTWFRSLPVRLELDALRLVHACWDRESLDVIDAHTPADGILSDAFLQQATQEHHPLFEAIETVLKGPEVWLPDGHTLPDAEGFRRRKLRGRWFESPRRHSIESYAFPPRSLPELAAVPVPADCRSLAYQPHERPVFFGHYWMSPAEPPGPVAGNVACLDFSVARGGLLCAYRHDGESPLSADRFVSVACRARV